MRQFRKKIAMCIAVFTAALTMTAAPSRMRPVEAVSPDGQVVTVVPVGDEYNRYYIDVQGRKVEWLPQVSRTPHVADASRLQRAKRLTSFPTLGEQKFLVVLVEFEDKYFSFSDPGEEFDAMLNGRGYDRYNATGSVADYYIDNSVGAFMPEFVVAGPVRLPYPYKKYGAGSTDDTLAGMMVMEACEALDDVIDFSEFDLDGDGKVDNVYFFYAGLGEADGGDINTIWPHAWSLEEQGRELVLDGVNISAYACSPELDGGRKPNGIGTFCHEFGHVLGLPDLYSTVYSGAFHPARWDVMSNGNYNNDGRTPPCMSAYERYELGWLEPMAITGQLSGVLRPIMEVNEAYRISTNNENEYFLFENRQPIKWDEYLPGHGMLVWHIDYDEEVWKANKVNNKPLHQHVDIVEANCATSHSQDAGFTFPGASLNTELTATTTPPLEDWAGVPIDLPITNIAEINDIITFDVCGGGSGINDIIGGDVASKPDGLVNVYAITGQVLRYQIPRSRALIGLAPGLYIVDDEKLCVK